MPKAKVSKNTLERLVPVLLFASIVLAFAVGILWEKVAALENGGTTTTGTPAQATTAGNDAPTTLGKLSADRAEKLTPVSDNDHIKGSRDAKVYLIEYSDLECPYCQQFHSTAQQVVGDYDGQVAWVYRHFPLEQIHPQARPAANAAECVYGLAGEDTFWKFVDSIFSDQQKTLNDLATTAVNVGVDKQAFQPCFDAKKYDNVVEDDYQGGLSAGVTGTPSNFIVNDKGDVWFIPGAYPYSQVKTIIDEALGN